MASFYELFSPQSNQFNTHGQRGATFSGKDLETGSGQGSGSSGPRSKRKLALDDDDSTDETPKRIRSRNSGHELIGTGETAAKIRLSYPSR